MNANLERHWNNPEVGRDMDATARRERAQVLRRFLEQAAQALLGPGTRAKRGHRIDTSRPCEAC
ncbi:MAG TPA: hypothetical protein VGP71_10210 [Burkholderiales bacterium]|jgi:hypothetical protein|nr:hypothetical protein [Burkholderiales bacterium]